jgi:hypothetical protein
VRLVFSARTTTAKQAVAFLCLGTVLLLDLLSVSAALHERLHNDAGKADHQCAVTLFSQGKTHFCPPPDALQRPGVVLAAVSSTARPFLATPVKYQLLPGRAPPFLPV